MHWVFARDESLIRRLALFPLYLASLIYGAGARLHRFVYERGLLRRRRLPCLVVSVGSPLAGGSAKTPSAAWLARSLRREGLRPALASRGFGRRGRQRVAVVSDGRSVQASVREVGDEPLVLVSHAPGVPVVVGRDRGLAGLRAVGSFGAELLVLDDGFQHHRLARDVDLITLDGAFGFGNRHVLPRGPLREPLSALARADALLVVDPPLAPEDAALLDRHAPGLPRFEARRRATSLRSLRRDRAFALESLSGLEVGLLCAVARPDAVRRTLEGLGAAVVAERSLPDHHYFRKRDLAGLDLHARVWIATEKDAVKILPHWARHVDLRILRIELEVGNPQALLAWLDERLDARREPVGGAAALRL